MKVSTNQYKLLQSFHPADDLEQVTSTIPSSSSSSSSSHHRPHHHPHHPSRNHKSSPAPAMFLFLRRYPLYVFIAFQVIFFILYLTHSRLQPKCSDSKQYDWITPEKFVSSHDGTKLVPYDRQLPIIFIGGMPRSGTTLLRVLLDSHPMIRCGEETRLIPRILSYRQTWTKVRFESERLKQAGITSEVLDSAISSFILEIIVKHGRPAPRLCNKDPFTIRSAVYLNGLFPKSKFIFMIRDGRAVVHSIMTRKVTISGFDLSDFRQCLTKWNAAMESMNKQCQELGKEHCLPVIYEDLVLHPKRSLERILKFLDVPWNDTVLHHENVIESGQISLSKLERSTDQVIKPINMEALSKWVGHIPADVSENIDKIAPMLTEFGYDLNCDSANYGTPDKELIEKINSQTSEDKKRWNEAEELAIKTREKFIEQIRAKTQDKNAKPADDIGSP